MQLYHLARVNDPFSSICHGNSNLNVLVRFSVYGFQRFSGGTYLVVDSYLRAHAVHVIAHMLHPGRCWSWSWTLMIFPHPRIYINIDEFIARWPRTLISSKKLICGGVFTHFLIFWTNMLVVCCLLHGIHFSAEGIFSPDLGLGRGRRK